MEEYNDKLFGQFDAPDSIEDAFVAKKRAEIEAEKAAISGSFDSCYCYKKSKRDHQDNKNNWLSLACFFNDFCN